MSCFEQAPEFIDEDNRQFRLFSPISKDMMESKHDALLPPDMLKGKTVLDLGCCLGATGHWCLSHGAAHYTGVELQATYAETARRLLEKYHPGRFAVEQAPIEDWLRQQGRPQFDIVCLLGVLYGFIDYYSVLKRCAELTRATMAVEGLYPVGKAANLKFCGVQFLDSQKMNLADRNSSVLGHGTRLSPKGLEWIMTEFGFASKDGVLLPRPFSDVPDSYNRPLTPQNATELGVRYLMRLDRRDGVSVRSTSEELRRGSSRLVEW